MGLFDGLFGKGRAAKLAREAELRGDLGAAVASYVDAGMAEEAARVLTLRGDAEPDPRGRLVFYTQAVQVLPAAANAATQARRKRAELRAAMASDTKHAGMAARDLREAAEELEAIGDYDRAEQLFIELGDKLAQARVLTAAGEIDRLESLLAEGSAAETAERSRANAAQQVRVAISEGDRRRALELATELGASGNQAAQEGGLRELIANLRARRCDGPVIEFALGEEPHAQRLKAVLGAEVIIGRSDGTLNVAHGSVSRKHLSIRRGAHGAEVRDLDTRNGTLLRGQRLGGAIPVGDGLELRLGGEVRVGLAPSKLLRDCIELELSGDRYLLPLGALRLPVALEPDAEIAAELTMAFDHWIEIARATRTLYQGELTMAPRIQVLRGDNFAHSRSRGIWLRIL